MMMRLLLLLARAPRSGIVEPWQHARHVGEAVDAGVVERGAADRRDVVGDVDDVLRATVRRDDDLLEGGARCVGGLARSGDAERDGNRGGQKRIARPTGSGCAVVAGQRHGGVSPGVDGLIQEFVMGGWPELSGGQPGARRPAR